MRRGTCDIASCHWSRSAGTSSGNHIAALWLASVPDHAGLPSTAPDCRDHTMEENIAATASSQGVAGLRAVQACAVLLHGSFGDFVVTGRLR